MKTKEDEAKQVKAAYKRLRADDRSLTQEALADEFNVTQSMVAQWMNGRTRIPDSTLLMLSGRLGFDPLEVRPEIKEKYLLAKQVLTNGDKIDRLREMMESLTSSELEEIELLAELLVLRRTRETKSKT